MDPAGCFVLRKQAQVLCVACWPCLKACVSLIFSCVCSRESACTVCAPRVISVCECVRLPTNMCNGGYRFDHSGRNETIEVGKHIVREF